MKLIQKFLMSPKILDQREVAEICVKYNPKISLKETNDEVPNLGFFYQTKNY